MFLKYLIPFDRFDIKSSLSAAEALNALQGAVEPKKLFRLFDRGSKSFEGVFEGNRFRITRLIGYRNSFLPVVVGEVDPAPGGSTIRIHMRPLLFVIVFCSVWLSGLVSIGGVLMSQLSWARIQDEPWSLAPVGMLVFFAVLVNGGFWFEAVKQKKMLLALLHGIA